MGGYVTALWSSEDTCFGCQKEQGIKWSDQNSSKKSPKILANTFSDALAILKKMIVGKKNLGGDLQNDIINLRMKKWQSKWTRHAPYFLSLPYFTKWAWPAPLKIERTGGTPELEIRKFVNCDCKARTRTKGDCSSWEGKYKEKDKLIRHCCSVLRTHPSMFRAKLDPLQYSKKSSTRWYFAMGKSTR